MLAAIALALLMAAVVAYAERRAIARAVLAGWLRSQGVDAQIAIQGLGPSGLRGVLRLGPAADPDFTVESADIRYDLGWGPGGLTARPTEIRLVRPMLKARWQGGRLTFGSLDPLIDKLLRRPPQANAALPTLSVDQARLVLDTDAGRLIGHGAGRFDKGRLQRLDLATEAATLKSRDLVASLAPGEWRLSLTGERLTVTGHGALTSLRGPGGELDAASLDLSGHAPYPDLRLHSAAGPADLLVTAVARGGRLDQIRLDGLKVSASLKGQLSGWGDQLGLGGLAVSSLEADRVAVGQTVGRGVRLQAVSHDFTWTRSQGDHLLGALAMTAELKGLDQGALRLVDLAARLEGPAAARAGDVRLDLAGSVATRGSWTGLGPSAAADTPDGAALKRALAGFRVSAPRLTVRVSQEGLALGLGAPVRLATDTGGGGAVQPAGGPLYAGKAGAFRLTLDGRGGLPRAELAVDRYRLAGGDASGQARLDASASLGPMIGAHVKLAGPFRIAGGGFEMRSDACAELSVDRIRFGENDLEALTGQLCPMAGPLLALASGGWRAVGEARGVSARVPFLEATVTGAAGPVAFSGHGDQLEMSAELKTARLEDRAAPRRFQPILAKGSAALKSGIAHGEFGLSDPQGRRLATATLHNRTADGIGQLDLDTGRLAFAPGGLQPAALSPRAGALGSPVQGLARFSGQLAWTPKGAAGSGTLTIERLDFRSPAGKVTNLRGQVIFDGLAPLHAAPGQTFRADSVGALVPLTSVVGVFGLEPDAAQVTQVSFVLAGGQVRMEPFAFPLADGAAWRATVDVDAVQLADLVAPTSFADQLDLNARVSGRMPFAVTPQGVRVTEGELHAIAPGHLSIRRGALSQVAAQGGAPTDPKATPAPIGPQSPYSDFVNQALEHLAFSELKAQVNSLAGGKLGVLFHIKGHHQPPQDQQIRLTWREALSRKIDRQLPLPSGTGIDLTLDTSLNLDQLLKDFADYQSLRGSGAVQPPASNLQPRRRP